MKETEFACYFLVAVLGVTGIFRHRRVVLAIALTLLCFYASQRRLPTPFSGYGVGQDHPFQAIPRLFSFFLVGSSFYLYRDKIAYRGWSAALAASLLAIAMNWAVTSRLALPVLGGYLLFAAAFCPIGRGIGPSVDISYGTYLYAWPIQSLLVLNLGKEINPWLLLAISTPLSLLAGWASWHLVEKGPLKLKNFSMFAMPLRRP